MLRQMDHMLNIVMKRRNIPKNHYDARMNLAKDWSKFPGLKDHAASLKRRDHLSGC